ncbi:MAG TPA: hypothetical protein VNT99_19265 [Methylomirabilota bacterium]|nr:hypothetical protein [Methylomirabilota bacterium]
MKSIPQREFAFVPDVFALVLDCGLDGERLARERDELEAARRANEAAQRRLPLKARVSKKRVAKGRKYPLSVKLSVRVVWELRKIVVS